MALTVLSCAEVPLGNFSLTCVNFIVKIKYMQFFAHKVLYSCADWCICLPHHLIKLEQHMILSRWHLWWRSTWWPGRQGS